MKPAKNKFVAKANLYRAAYNSINIDPKLTLMMYYSTFQNKRTLKNIVLTIKSELRKETFR